MSVKEEHPGVQSRLLHLVYYLNSAPSDSRNRRMENEGGIIWIKDMIPKFNLPTRVLEKGPKIC